MIFSRKGKKRSMMMARHPQLEAAPSVFLTPAGNNAAADDDSDSSTSSTTMTHHAPLEKRLSFRKRACLTTKRSFQKLMRNNSSSSASRKSRGVRFQMSANVYHSSTHVLEEQDCQALWYSPEDFLQFKTSLKQDCEELVQVQLPQSSGATTNAATTYQEAMMQLFTAVYKHCNPAADNNNNDDARSSIVEQEEEALDATQLQTLQTWLDMSPWGVNKYLLPHVNHYRVAQRRQMMDYLYRIQDDYFATAQVLGAANQVVTLEERNDYMRQASLVSSHTARCWARCVAQAQAAAVCNST